MVNNTYHISLVFHNIVSTYNVHCFVEYYLIKNALCNFRSNKNNKTLTRINIQSSIKLMRNWKFYCQIAMLKLCTKKYYSFKFLYLRRILKGKFITLFISEKNTFRFIDQTLVKIIKPVCNLDNFYFGKF